jgi:hypothetical protein
MPELKEGDRIRIVLAGAPLEHLTGALGTVEGAETFGLIPVLVDGVGSKLFRREQLDILDDIEKEKKGEIHCPTPLEIPETIDSSLPAPFLEVGSIVKHERYWLNTAGVVKEIRGATALVKFREGTPLYPADVSKLRVLQ